MRRCPRSVHSGPLRKQAYRCSHCHWRCSGLRLLAPEANHMENVNQEAEADELLQANQEGHEGAKENIGSHSPVGTPDTRSGGCVLVTLRHGVVCVRFRSRTVIGHALHSSCPSLPLLPFWLSAELYFVPPCPSLLCLGWITTDHPRSWVIFCFGLSVGCCFSYRAGIV